MTKQWRPHVDLARLSAALSEEILAAPDAELRLLLGDPGFSAAATAQDVRDAIATAIGEPDEPKPSLGQGDGHRRNLPAL